jgi:hypothetical protein
MQTSFRGGRLPAAVVSICLVGSAALPARAIDMVLTGDPGGSMTCYNCGANNRTQKSGSAVSGYADGNDDGTANAGMGYTTPNDGTTYSGTLSIVTTASDGTLLSNFTGGLTDVGMGTIVFAGYDGVSLPVGGSVSVSVSESNGLGGSFNASWSLRNFHP